MTIKAPVLLDSSMQDARRLDPSSLSVQRTLAPPSVADMSLPLDGGAVPIRSFVRLYTVHGSAGVFRVSSVETDYEACEQRLSLAHGICTLEDVIVPAPTGDDAETEVEKSPEQMLSWLLGKQHVSHWQAGTVAASGTVYLEQNGSTVMQMLAAMMDQLPDYDLTLSQDSYPWTIGIAAKQTTVNAEGRLSRNLASARVTYDDSELCTRLYSPQLTGGYLDADTVSTYGVVESFLYTSAEGTEAAQIAQRYLNRRKEPAVSVEIDAVDLSGATVETLDRFELGKRFRLALPDFGLTVTQWITGIAYADVYGDPEHMTLTLANAVADMAERSKKAKEAEAEAVKSSARTQKIIEKHDTKLEKTDSYLTFLDDQGVTVWRDTTASVEVGDAFAAMKAQVTDTYGHIATKSDIVQTLQTAGVTVDATKSLAEIYATEQITRKSATETNAAAIQVNATAITSKVSKNGVISEINQTAESIKISASRVNLEGYVTASNLAATISDLGYVDISQANITQLTLGQYVRFDGHNFAWQSQEVVTGISVSRDQYTGIALANSSFEVNGRISQTYMVHNVTASKTTIYYLGY